MTPPLVVGNWKMNGTQSRCFELAGTIAEHIRVRPTGAEVAVAPPFTGLAAARKALGDSPVQLAAQNCHWELNGAFTGEVSPSMLKELDCAYVIIGHSERRHLLHESDDMIARKITPIIAERMRPILCIGETRDERRSGMTDEIVLGQLRSALKGLANNAIDNLEIAYEPVWAIGTGQNASAEQIREVHSQIRQFMVASFGASRGDAVRILYGGSVKPENAAEIIAIENVNGLLVGGASLEADSFMRIVRAFSAN